MTESYEHEFDLLARIVRDVEVFVDTVSNGTFKHQANSVCINIGLRRTEGRICQIDARGIETQLAGVDEYPGLAIDVEVIGTDEAGIDGIDAFVALWIDLSTLVGDHEGASLADGDAGRGDFDFYRHGFLLILFRFLHNITDSRTPPTGGHKVPHPTQLLSRPYGTSEPGFFGAALIQLLQRSQNRAGGGAIAVLNFYGEADQFVDAGLDL